ncbi:MAG: hypothetical protein ABIS50_05440 [Luteolibacter sp.]|uniref:hypothetical protein n=1 Tax=Luteolibacter sp. TaxID=1962973 RepID=UPI00326794D2
MINLTKFTRALAILIASATLPVSAHQHRAVGVLDTNANGVADAGEPLQIIGVNGTDIIHYLRPRGVGEQPRPEGYHPELRGGGYYYLDERPRRVYDAQGSPAFDNLGQPIVADEGFSLVALSSDPDFPEPGHAHPGALISCEIVSVTGPQGGSFGFWDAAQSFYYGTPTFVLPTNQPTGSRRFIISEGDDYADADPYGHIHDRAWSANIPGGYFVTIRFIDISTNRPGGSPWHTPSRNYVYHFKAGPDFKPSGRRVAGAEFVLTWSSQMGISNTAYPPETGMVFRILRSTTLAPGEWTSIGQVTGTTTATLSFTDPSPPAAKAFYKLAYDWSAP